MLSLFFLVLFVCFSHRIAFFPPAQLLFIIFSFYQSTANQAFLSIHQSYSLFIHVTWWKGFIIIVIILFCFSSSLSCFPSSPVQLVFIIFSLYSQQQNKAFLYIYQGYSLLIHVIGWKGLIIIIIFFFLSPLSCFPSSHVQLVFIISSHYKYMVELSHARRLLKLFIIQTCDLVERHHHRHHHASHLYFH